MPFWKLEHVLAFLPGIVVGTLFRFQEISKCLLSDCESWTLKVEKVLTHLAFVLGFTTPSLLIWKVLKTLMKGVSVKIPAYLEAHRDIENYIWIGLAYMEQKGLAQVWDTVRESSLCMRYNNCANDFLCQLSNIKIQVCDVQNPRDVDRKITVCEKLFNDAPLILLALTMLVLMIISNTQLSTEDLFRKVNTATDPQKDKDDTSKPKPEPPPPPGPTSPIPDPTTTTPTPTPGKPSPTTPSTSKPNTQVVHAQCPNCSKLFDCTIPRPWVLYCSSSVPLIKKGVERKKESKKGKGTLTEEDVKEMRKQIKCKYCKSVITKCLKDIRKKKGSEKKSKKDNGNKGSKKKYKTSKGKSKKSK